MSRETWKAEGVEDIDWDTWQPVDRGTLLFVVRNQRILLIHKKRGLGAGKINGPGGRLDDGESPQECALREVHEEIGVHPRGTRPSGQLFFQFVDGYSIHVWVFRADDFEGELIETDEARPFWVDLEEIPYDSMWSDDEIWFPWMLTERPFVGRFLFDGDRMLGHRVIAVEKPGIETDPWFELEDTNRNGSIL